MKIKLQQCFTSLRKAIHHIEPSVTVNFLKVTLSLCGNTVANRRILENTKQIQKANI